MGKQTGFLEYPRELPLAEAPEAIMAAFEENAHDAARVGGK